MEYIEATQGVGRSLQDTYQLGLKAQGSLRYPRSNFCKLAKVCLWAVYLTCASKWGLWVFICDITVEFNSQVHLAATI